MDKMFSAILDLHPNCEVRDFRLLANLVEVSDKQADELDAEFADAIRSSELKDITNIT